MKTLMITVLAFLGGYIYNAQMHPQTSEDLSDTPMYIHHAIYTAAKERQVNPALAFAVAEVESSMKPGKTRLEPRFHSISVGLFQMFLPTAQNMGFKGNVDQLKDTDTNVNLGVRNLARCSVRFKTIRGVACCHNAGLHVKQSVCVNNDWVVHYENKVVKAYRKYAMAL